MEGWPVTGSTLYWERKKRKSSGLPAISPALPFPQPTQRKDRMILGIRRNLEHAEHEVSTEKLSSPRFDHSLNISVVAS
ncbi:hypothetical protein TGPRC2_265255 [Toxoplasma gondii TgCatPRC2]|uniref:Uncharacterized protein n=14 Tax=Toxoplasma gondii TaxID=5811 RepID=A0A125YJQ5_TOXGV|nr:hypothetical protein TGME49_265255 [Toxoplasma gondii ME49]EPR57362.1 hypothetical protein TGGT1_265255 [Toxoplasma gondii GT1]ESS33652.1 hypothetical protein TGVEG_265255 [Toxoplasma gondii VEG]KAF4644229.1 hypothetical protein TGRH88_012210 [Toxoplasma gondii]KFG32763.1 hypothetical protein TGP89_265255 [Toxoplasma gondii p89]KFG38568.1 hypothetical protein TGDOM2_265255 [Toxoplasma gondii GAB2-2007-GAL-DOM2]KFG42130.1 hypothetical protein TGFOU_265255 [Toxoplasma gondii FOU]KFG58315.1 |eukprot:XP_018636305.1 hypothetical protein TGME49_265255 [Toxoplasma gondii ME49]